MAVLSDLNFQPGLDFQALVHDRFGPLALVSSPSPSGDFFLVVSFARSSIRLDEGSVSLILQSVLGGGMPWIFVWFISPLGSSVSQCPLKILDS